MQLNTRHSLRPLLSWRVMSRKTRARCVARMLSLVFLPSLRANGAHSRDPLARNDGCCLTSESELAPQMDAAAIESVRASASASRRHDVPSATSGVPAPTSNPNGGDGCACGGADGRSSLQPSEPPALVRAKHSIRSLQGLRQQRQRLAEYPSGRCGESLHALCLLPCQNHFRRRRSRRFASRPSLQQRRLPSRMARSNSNIRAPAKEPRLRMSEPEH